MISDESYDRVLECIYDAALEPQRWREVVDALTDGFQAIGSSAYTLFASRAGIEGIWSTDADAELITAYASKYASEDILAEALWQKIPLPSLVYSLREMVPASAIETWEGFKVLLEPRGVRDCVGLVVDGDGHRATQLMIYTPRWPEEKIDLAKRAMQRISSHFQRAMRIHWHLENARAAANTAQITLDMFSCGVAWLSEKRTVLYRNEEMARILGMNDGVAASGDSLRLADPAAQRALSAAVERAAAGEDTPMLVPRNSGFEPFRARVCPLPLKASALRLPGAAAILFVSEAARLAETATERASHIYQLTPAEARVLKLLMSGQDVKTMTDSLGTSEATIRTQLKSVMAKCGTTRQADLVRLVALIR